MKKISFLLLSFLGTSLAYAQEKTYNLGIEAQTSLTTSGQVPFWLRSNQYGSLPLSGLSASFIGFANKQYDTTKARLFDWGASVEARANVGKSSNLTLIEGYGKVKIGIFELKGGRVKEVMGLADTLLSSGNFAFSGNALGIPKVQISIPEFYTLPFLGRLFAVKGHWAHGWLGNVNIQEKRVDQAKTFLHQKAFWARIGKEEGKFKLYGGFNDNALWGQERKIFESFILTDWQIYQSVAFGKNWADSKVGNHAGTIDLRMEYELNNLQLALYRQNFYEVGALYHLANIADGLNGIVLTNKVKSPADVRWKRILFEFLYTKNQAGETWSKPTPSGNENYHNHYMYSDGWSYRGQGLGTPFFTPEHLARPGFPSRSANYFINNRVVAFHTGLNLSVRNWNTLAKLSYSKNFGTHHTRQLFQPAQQFSAVIESDKALTNKLVVGGLFAFDAGKMLNNSAAILLRASRKF